MTSGLAASLIAAAISTLGVGSVWFLGDWGRRTSSVFSAFAVGILSVAVLFHLFPQAIDAEPTSWRFALGAFILMAVVGMSLRLAMISRRHGGAPDEGDMAFGFASLVALGFHSFVDGLLYSSSFHGDEYTGWVATFGLLLHEFPEGAIAYFLIHDSGLGRAWSAVVAFAASSATTVAGALVAEIMLTDPSPWVMGPLLGATSGALIYVIALHLGPHASLARRPLGYRAAAAGVVIATLAETLRHAGHAH